MKSTTPHGGPRRSSPLRGSPSRRVAEVNVHQNAATEVDASDLWGQQGGQDWVHPTELPTEAPTTETPTATPSAHPTMRGEEMTLRGMMWYDRNANGLRDSNVQVEGLGGDVEYSHGVGGVTIDLIQCDPDTGRAASDAAVQDTYAMTSSVGVDATGHPQVVPNSGNNAKYNLYLNGLELYYYVEVTAPANYKITSGICNSAYDNITDSPFHCDYDNAITPPEDSRRRLYGARSLLNARARRAQDQVFDGDSYGIQHGRSKECVYIDKHGMVQNNLYFGIMREGDTQEVAANVAILLDFDPNTKPGRALFDALARAEFVEDEGGRGRYLLAEVDKRAIGSVTAEVIATTLDNRLAEHGVDLSSVNPQGVAVTSAGEAGNEGSQLAVRMEIKGHYSPPPVIDFDYIVQDSINTDTGTIRRSLRDYNRHCRSQTSKVVQQGKTEEDFKFVISRNGAARPGVNGGRPAVNVNSLSDGVFSTACSTGEIMPDYFETDLKEVGARKVFPGAELSDREDLPYVARDTVLKDWAAGPVATIAGLIVLLMGAFVFRRALGPRRADDYSDARKTKDVDGDEMRRFGEAGGGADDGSVDSAFYSASDEEETEKERKMRRKRKEKGDEQRNRRGGARRGGSRRDLMGNKGSLRKSLTGMRGKSASRRDSRRDLMSSLTGGSKGKSASRRDLMSSLTGGSKGKSASRRDLMGGNGKSASRRELMGGKSASRRDLAAGRSASRRNLTAVDKDEKEQDPPKSRRGSRGSRRKDGGEGKLAASQGSDDTHSLGRLSSSHSSDDVEKNAEKRKDDADAADDKKERKRRGKLRRAESSRTAASSSSKRDRRSRRSSSDGRRGRSKRSGGDNAKAYAAESIDEDKIV